MENGWIRTICQGCYGQCGLRVNCSNGVVTEIEGDPDFPINWGKTCAKAKAYFMSLYDPNRVKAPLRRTNPEKGIGVDPGWQEITWEEAMTTIAARMRKVRDEDPRKLLIATFDWGTMDLAMLWASAFGTPNIKWHGGGYFCGNALHAVSYMTNSTFHTAIDLDYCEYAVLFGSQHGFMGGVNPNLIAQKMAKARARGMKLVVVDPVGTNAAAKADLWLPIRPGTDAALAMAMIHVLLNEEGIYDEPFLKYQTNAPYLVDKEGHYVRDGDGKPLIWDLASGTPKPYDSWQGSATIRGQEKTQVAPALVGRFEVNGTPCVPAFERIKEGAKSYTPEKMAKITSLPAEQIREVARDYGRSARVGSTIEIDGETLPFRPAAVHAYRGAFAHKHGTQTHIAIQLLNLLVGSLYVPGGAQGSDAVGPNQSWAPVPGPDGLMVTGKIHHSSVYPPTDVAPPELLELRELFPISCSVSSAVGLSLKDHKKYQIPYDPEILIVFRANPMMSRVAPEETAQALRNIPFTVSITREFNETAEFADIVLPDTHDLERLDIFPNRFDLLPEIDYWFWGVRQPVVKPYGQARHWAEVLLELSERVGFRRDFYEILNINYKLKNGTRLDPSRPYRWDEICDCRARSAFGEEHGLDWFKKNGSLRRKRTVPEMYSRVFLDCRFPVYFEFFIDVGKDVAELMKKMGLEWDTSDYLPVPFWKPCPDFKEHGNGEHLYAVSYKVPFHSLSNTSDNPWLVDLTERHPYANKVLLHTDAARARGIHTGDLITVESVAGKVKGRAKVTECIHPEVIGISGIFGHWAKNRPIGRNNGAHFNSLLPLNLERMDMVSAAIDSCIRVKVSRA